MKYNTKTIIAIIIALFVGAVLLATKCNSPKLGDRTGKAINFVSPEGVKGTVYINPNSITVTTHNITYSYRVKKVEGNRYVIAGLKDEYAMEMSPLFIQWSHNNKPIPTKCWAIVK